MRRRVTPWAVVAAIMMLAFIVWLGAQMSRTGRADRILWTLVIAFALAGIALAAGAAHRRRRSRPRR